MPPESLSLHWRLSSFYFFYFASIGALIPYWGLYLQSQGYSAQQIATVFAVIMATKIVSPNIWGWIADHTGQRMRLIRLASCLAIVSFFGVFVSTDYGWIILVMMVFSFFWNANLPQFEAVTLSHLGENVSNYSRIRLWGSWGFVITVMALGMIFDSYGVELFPLILAVLLLGIWACSFLVSDKKIRAVESSSVRLVSVLRQPQVLIFLLICFLLQASHGPYYAFYSIYLEQHDYSRTLIGELWALGVIAEIIIFMLMYHLLRRWSVRTLLAVSLLLTSIRWLIIAYFVDSLPLLIVAQCFHAASFGVFHAVAIHLIHQFFSGSVQGRGQALYSSLSFGLGGAVGALYSGYSWEGVGPEATFEIAALISFVAMCLALAFLKPLSKSLKNSE